MFTVGIAGASMPTRELTGAQPGERSGGVGALPGNNTESAVAIPPAEKTGYGSGLDKHTAEDTAMADAAKKAAATSQSPTSESKPAAEEKPKAKESQSHKGQPNKVSLVSMVSGIRERPRCRCLLRMMSFCS